MRRNGTSGPYNPYASQAPPSPLRTMRRVHDDQLLHHFRVCVSKGVGQHPSPVVRDKCAGGLAECENECVHVSNEDFEPARITRRQMGGRVEESGSRSLLPTNAALLVLYARIAPVARRRAPRRLRTRCLAIASQIRHDNAVL